MSIQEQVSKMTHLLNSQDLTWLPQDSIKFEQAEIKCSHAFSQKDKFYSMESTIQNLSSNLAQVQPLYLKMFKNVQKIDSSVFLNSSSNKLSSYAPVYMDTKEIISFKAIQDKIYVVHLLNPEQSSSGMTRYTNTWEMYVEEISVVQNNTVYKCLFGVKNDKGNIHTRLLHGFLKENIQKIVLNLRNLQEDIMKAAHVTKNQGPITPDPSFDPVHLRLPKLTNKQKTIFYKFKEKHPQASDNELCRFLTAKNFETQEAEALYVEYKRWKKEMEEKYTLDSFKQYHDRQYMSYVGKDKMGRPIILIKAAKIFPDEIEDQDLYLKYMFYFTEIYIGQQMTGHVDQLVMLADLEDNLSTRNFKISLSMKNMEGMNKYSPERLHKSLIVNTNSFGVWVWNILKPFVPKITKEKIQIIGNKANKVKQMLLNEISQEVVPTFLGGKNSRIF